MLLLAVDGAKKCKLCDISEKGQALNLDSYGAIFAAGVNQCGSFEVNEVAPVCHPVRIWPQTFLSFID